MNTVLCITGAAGSGKSTAARVIDELARNKGVLVNQHLKASDLAERTLMSDGLGNEHTLTRNLKNMIGDLPEEADTLTIIDGLPRKARQLKYLSEFDVINQLVMFCPVEVAVDRVYQRLINGGILPNIAWQIAVFRCNMEHLMIQNLIEEKTPIGIDKYHVVGSDRSLPQLKDVLEDHAFLYS